MEIKYAARFRSQYAKADNEIRGAFGQALEVFLEDQKDPHLRNHALRKKFVGYRSINVTDDWRAVFKERQTKKRITVTFHLLGTHKDLYGK